MFPPRGILLAAEKCLPFSARPAPYLLAKIVSQDARHTDTPASLRCAHAIIMLQEACKISTPTPEVFR